MKFYELFQYYKININIISDIHTGATKRFELDEKERLIEKIKPDRRSHIPQQLIKIRMTKKFRQKHKKLNMILDHIINSYKKKRPKDRCIK